MDEQNKSVRNTVRRGWREGGHQIDRRNTEESGYTASQESMPLGVNEDNGDPLRDEQTRAEMGETIGRDPEGGCVPEISSRWRPIACAKLRSGSSGS